mmetsp:Transcript_10833/g.20266  ORF Transcript_10833/g.20266 Transcript_10833/m.20266 type:complete len:95 (+) Transcript_10833:1736-2020(+)
MPRGTRLHRIVLSAGSFQPTTIPQRIERRNKRNSCPGLFTSNTSIGANTIHRNIHSFKETKGLNFLIVVKEILFPTMAKTNTIKDVIPTSLEDT